MPAAPLITITDFDFAYGAKQVFSGLSLTIAAGSVHGMLGPNGAGKSTLFNSLFGHTHHPAISVAPGFERQFAYAQAEPYFYPFMTGREYLELVGAPQHADVAQWNELFRLPLDEYVHHYSTGMKRKISLLGAILPGKKILLLDEPINGLDLEATELFRLVVAQLQRRGTTLIVSSHILESLFAISDRITLLGKPVQTYERAEFPTLEATVRAGFGGKAQLLLDRLLPNLAI